MRTSARIPLLTLMAMMLLVIPAHAAFAQPGPLVDVLGPVTRVVDVVDLGDIGRAIAAIFGGLF